MNRCVWQWAGVCVCAMLLVAGCGPSRPKVAKVTGTVTMNGKPVEGATVAFFPQNEVTPGVGGGRMASGVTDAQGKFKLMTFEPGDGAVLGKHKVTVTLCQDISKKRVEGDAPDPANLKWIVPQKYSETGTTPLPIVDVQGALDLPIDIKP